MKNSVDDSFNKKVKESKLERPTMYGYSFQGFGWESKPLDGPSESYIDVGTDTELCPLPIPRFRRFRFPCTPL